MTTSIDSNSKIVAVSTGQTASKSAYLQDTMIGGFKNMVSNATTAATNVSSSAFGLVTTVGLMEMKAINKVVDLGYKTLELGQSLLSSNSGLDLDELEKTQEELDVQDFEVLGEAQPPHEMPLPMTYKINHERLEKKQIERFMEGIEQTNKKLAQRIKAKMTPQTTYRQLLDIMADELNGRDK